MQKGREGRKGETPKSTNTTQVVSSSAFSYVEHAWSCAGFVDELGSE